jgi:hypothetical protein
MGRDALMKTKIFRLKLMATAMLVIAAASFPAQAQSSASGSLDLDSLTITPVSGTISGWTGWSLNALSTTLNSDGGFSQNFDFESSPTVTATTSALVAYASASTTATATSLDNSGISGNASGSILIPGGINESASVSGGNGNYGSLEASFTLSAASSVSFDAIISAAQAMQTDAGGQVLENELTLNLNVDGTPVVFYDNPLTLGPSSTYSSSLTDQPYDGTVALAAGSHDLYIELDDEQQVLETVVPEPSTCLLLLMTLGAGLAWKMSATRGFVA